MIAPPAVIVGPAIVAAAEVFVLLPAAASMLLIGWIVASFPIGIMLGHCVLRDKVLPDK